MASKKINKSQNKIINFVFKEIEKGKYGEVDWHWDGHKMLKDNIIFSRQEFKSILKEVLMVYRRVLFSEVLDKKYQKLYNANTILLLNKLKENVNGK